MVEASPNSGALDVPTVELRSAHKSSQRSKVSSSRTPKIRKVNGYIIFYDDIIGQGQFGTVCKAQLASDLL